MVSSSDRAFTWVKSASLPALPQQIFTCHVKETHSSRNDIEQHIPECLGGQNTFLREMYRSLFEGDLNLAVQCLSYYSHHQQVWCSGRR